MITGSFRVSGVQGGREHPDGVPQGGSCGRAGREWKSGVASSSNRGVSHAAHQASQECQADCAELRGLLGNKFAIFLEKSIRMQKGDIVALTNEAE